MIPIPGSLLYRDKTFLGIAHVFACTQQLT